MHRFDLSAKAMKECARLNPNDPSLWQRYGETLSAAADPADAIEWLLKAQKADPGLDRVTFDLANAYMNNMDYQNAATYAQQAVAADARDAEARTLLATAEAKLAEWNDAVVDFERVLSSRSDDAPSLLELGHCKLELKEYQEAIDILNHLLRVDPKSFQAHLYLSRAYFGLGNTEESQHQAELHHRMMEEIYGAGTLIATSAEIDTGAWSGLTATPVSQLLAQHKEAEALEIYRNHFKGSATSLGDPYVFIGKLYFLMDKPDDSLRCLKHALEIQPKVRGAHTWLGMLALRRKDYEGAEREVNAELAIDPNDQRAIAELGEVRYWQGRWADAAEQIERSKPIEPELLFMLCDSYFHIGDAKNANLTAEILVAYGRQNAPLMQQLFALLNGNHQQALAERLSADLAQP
jgi:tetratricopeptide (TPR) repeat protein